MKKILTLFVIGLAAIVSAENEVKDDRIRIRAFIDKEDILHIQNDKVWFTHVIGAYPGQWGMDWPTYVNGVKWKPNWDNAPNSDVFRMTNLHNALPMDRKSSESIVITLLQTNSVASVIEYPDEANWWTLIIRLDNTKTKGASWMDLDITWNGDDMPRYQRREVIIRSPVPDAFPIVPPTVPSPTPIGLR